ncbi:hypothetical protein SLEP1_g15767 [Rubroshorea leprosula]|uniref:Uncharacterized protein n=1 Tax=Rubroshorea leprosula TaxID=152421 RepID=A0AAV5IUK4_9ROSI|nr:hypothetical protein SLEP1_g15767 [Rubroshorea leprosula]
MVSATLIAGFHYGFTGILQSELVGHVQSSADTRS